MTISVCAIYGLNKLKKHTEVHFSFFIVSPISLYDSLVK